MEFNELKLTYGWLSSVTANSPKKLAEKKFELQLVQKLREHLKNSNSRTFSHVDCS
jgi:hypothetical protein